MKDLLEIGAAVTTPISLLGFLAGCVVIVYLAVLRNRIAEIKLLPEVDRAKAVDRYLTRYKIKVNDAPPDARIDLIKKELNHRLIKWFLVAFISLVFFAMVIANFRLGGRAGRPDALAANRKTVLAYKQQLVDLRGDIESRNPNIEIELRRKASQLASQMSTINDDQLGQSSKVIKHEYGGWAYLMTVCTFSGEPVVGPDESRLRVAKQAINEFDQALNAMAAIQSDCGENRDLCEWLTGESDDINRTHYLKAIALAVVAQAGGGVPKASTDELLLVSDAYMRAFPTDINPDLKWARNPQPAANP